MIRLEVVGRKLAYARNFSRWCIFGLSFGLLLFVGIGSWRPALAGGAVDEAQRLVERAESWYWFARATGDDLDAHRASKAHLEQALSHVRGKDDPQSVRLRAEIQAGLKRSDGRIDNAQDTFRNVVRGAWWIAHGDETVEIIDDPVIPALREALFEQLESSKRYNRAPRPYVLVRVHRTAPSSVDRPFDRKLQLEAMRDKTLTLADQAGIQGMPIDLVHPELLHTSALSGWGEPVGPHVSEVQEATGGGHLMVIDVDVADLFDRLDGWTSVEVTRVDVEMTLWDLQSGALVFKSSKHGFAQDMHGRWYLDLIWAAFMGLVATVMVAGGWWWTARRGDGPRVDPKLAILIGVVFFLGGAGLAGFATTISQEYVPNWYLPSFASELGPFKLPNPKALVWPAVHGAITLIGPHVLLAYGAVRLRGVLDERAFQRIDPDAALAVISPAAQAGAATVLFAPLVEAQASGYAIAVPISLASCTCAYVLSRPLADIVRYGAGSGRDLVVVGLALAALVLLLPLGLFDWYAWPVSGMCIGLASIGAMIGRDTGRAQIAEDGETEDDTLPEGNEVLHALALWVPPPGASRLMEHWSQRSVDMALVGVSGSGISRAVLEVAEQIQPGEPYLLVACPPPPDGDVSPFALASAMLRQAGHKKHNIAEALEKAQSVQRAASQATALAGALPGLSLVLGSASGSGGGDFERSRVIDDAAKGMVRLLKARLGSGAWLVVVDDIQDLDPSSADVLRRVREIAVEAGQPMRWLFGLHPEEESESCTRLLQDWGVRRVDVGMATAADIQSMLRGAACSLPPAEVVEWVLEASRGGFGRAHELVVRIFEAGGFIRSEDGGFQAVDDLDEQWLRERFENIEEAAMDAEYLRMQKLPERQQRIISVAALCGMRFSIPEIAVALDESDISIAETLRAHEDQFLEPLVIDIVDEPGFYRFSSKLAHRAVLLRNELLGREIAATVYRRVSMADPLTVAAERRFVHAQRASGDPATRQSRIRAAREVVESRTAQRAWPEVVSLVTGLGPELHAGATDDHTRIVLGHARALRAIGGQANREQLRMVILEQLRQDPTGHRRGPELTFDLVYLLLESWFEARLASEMNGLLEWCTHRGARFEDAPTRLLASLYACLAAREVEGALSEALVSRLVSLCDGLNPGFSRGIAGRRGQLVATMLWTTTANWRWQSHPKLDQTADEEAQAAHRRASRSFYFEEIQPQLERALAIKEEIGDDLGQAIVCGVIGSAYLFQLTDEGEADAQRALDWLDRDLAIVERAGLDSARAGVQNRRSMALERLGRIPEALVLAEDALMTATRLRRSTDQAFALDQLLALALTQPTAQLDAVAVERWCAIATSEIDWSDLSYRWLRAKIATRLSVAADEWSMLADTDPLRTTAATLAPAAG